ncbi:hypothetical protein [Haloarcula laminariae]|uniref:hypothetical protein n=1 Tax=Haloarcula laminariae TaxID=2961577 RepID=UPI0021C766DB|nr:hypothetical protein [Halomicroarcula laminariae]
MAADLQKWIAEFESEWADKPIEYLHEPGDWREDSDPLFSSISSAIQDRNYEISIDELLKISQWKMQGSRNDDNIKGNAEKDVDVEKQCQHALTEVEGKESIEALTDLSGIGVPMASTVLTVAKPEEYAIIDYRAFRGLAAALPEIVDSRDYSEYAEFLEHFRNYLTNAEAYEYYIEHVREIAEQEDLSARQVDMALWAFDKEKS